MYKQKARVLWRFRSTSYKLIAMLLDFQEKWENKFQEEVQAWDE